ncbi:hypothetical protein NQ317_015213 [Molorchus minor]|uniref:Uncharacterized protein n=1 Tax=Molorchus minor TaxID=1323400 RepID=A0ABQ9JCH3_9CUCU|nr:hypothetical protein NQ317_015213 [Molorchus minor]
MSKIFFGTNFTKYLATAYCRHFSASQVYNDQHSCKVLVVGGGTGGCAVAAKLCRKLKKKELFLLEPSEDHYYQPLFTLIGAGAATLEEATRREKDVLPKNCTWIKDKAVAYEPKKQCRFNQKRTYY